MIFNFLLGISHYIKRTHTVKLLLVIRIYLVSFVRPVIILKIYNYNKHLYIYMYMYQSIGMKEKTTTTKRAQISFLVHVHLKRLLLHTN